jgi:hypothetical protein
MFRNPRAEPRRFLEPAVDRFGRSVARAGPVEEGEHVGGSLLEGSAERDDLDERGRDCGTDGAISAA